MAQLQSAFEARVSAAAFALLREGRTPTVSLVRARMPGGGSPNQVAPALRAWRIALAESLQSSGGAAADVVPPSVSELLEALWSRALFEAHRMRQEEQDDRSAQLDRAVAAVRSLAARLEEREETLDRELNQLLRARQRPSSVVAASNVPAVAAKAKRRGQKAPPKAKPVSSRRKVPGARGAAPRRRAGGRPTKRKAR